MYNAIKTLLIISAGALVAACSGSASDEKQASDMLSQARACIEDGKYSEAIALIDSINKTFPSQLEIRRQTMPLKSEAQLGELEDKLIETNEILDKYQDEYDELSKKFTMVQGSGVGYYILKGAYGPNISESTAVQARVNVGDGSFCITASNSGSKLGITSVTLHGENGSMSTLPLSDSQRAGDPDKYGTDLATFAPSECDSLGSWAYNNAGRITSATISGTKGKKEIKFNNAQGSQFADAWRLGFIAMKLRDAKAMRERIERQILVARDHIDNPPGEKK